MSAEPDAIRQLERERAALAHELRRVCDALERNRTAALEAEAARLRDAVALCQRELAKTTIPGGKP